MPIRTVGGLFAGAIASPRRSIVVLVAGTTLGLAGVTTMQGCQTLGGLIPLAVKVCVDAVKMLLDLPLEELPDGYVPCGEPVTWEVRGSGMKFCFYCSLADPVKVYMQLGCTGSFYPFRLRPIGDPAAGDVPGAGSAGIDKVGCDERLLMKAQSIYDEWSGRASAMFPSPNTRLFPDPTAYATLGVALDGVPVSLGGDFLVTEGQRISVEGSLDEVAHYAMISGVTELAFEDGGVRYEVFVNADVSAMMLFRNGVCIEQRLLFAPVP
jgi:hypothetical protein